MFRLEKILNKIQWKCQKVKKHFLGPRKSLGKTAILAKKVISSNVGTVSKRKKMEFLSNFSPKSKVRLQSLDLELTLFNPCHNNKNKNKKNPHQNREFDTEDQVLSISIFDKLSQVSSPTGLSWYEN